MQNDRSNVDRAYDRKEDPAPFSLSNLFLATSGAQLSSKNAYERLRLLIGCQRDHVNVLRRRHATKAHKKGTVSCLTSGWLVRSQLDLIKVSSLLFFLPIFSFCEKIFIISQISKKKICKRVVQKSRIYMCVYRSFSRTFMFTVLSVSER